MVTITWDDVKNFTTNNYKYFIGVGAMGLSFYSGVQCQKGKDLNGNADIDGYKTTIVGNYLFQKGKGGEVEALKIEDVYNAFKLTREGRFGTDGKGKENLEKMTVTGKKVKLELTDEVKEIELKK